MVTAAGGTWLISSCCRGMKRQCAVQRAAAEKLEAGLRELEIMRVELTASRQNVDKAEFDKAKVGVLHSVLQQLRECRGCVIAAYP